MDRHTDGAGYIWPAGPLDRAGQQVVIKFYKKHHNFALGASQLPWELETVVNYGNNWWRSFFSSLFFEVQITFKMVSVTYLDTCWLIPAMLQDTDRIYVQWHQASKNIVQLTCYRWDSAILLRDNCMEHRSHDCCRTRPEKPCYTLNDVHFWTCPSRTLFISLQLIKERFSSGNRSKAWCNSVRLSTDFPLRSCLTN